MDSTLSESDQSRKMRQATQRSQWENGHETVKQFFHCKGQPATRWYVPYSSTARTCSSKESRTTCTCTLFHYCADRPAKLLFPTTSTSLRVEGRNWLVTLLP